MRASRGDRTMMLSDQDPSPLFEGGGYSIIAGAVGGDNTTTLSSQFNTNTGVQPQQPCNNEPIKHQNIEGNFLCSPSPINSNQKACLNNSQTIFSWNKNEEFHFDVPPEAPVFTPTESEFKNPLMYINKIRPIAEKYGICKIKPPAAWQPPFTVDVDKLRFTPRIQRLNELEAKTRVKLNFLDQIAKFWELQGSSLKIPMVERKALDLYSLHRIVQEEGGMEQTINNRKWSKVAARMGYPQGKSVGTILKSHYERILYPFDVYTSGKMDPSDLKLEIQETDDHDYKPHCIESRQQVSPPQETTARRSKRFAQNNQTFSLPAEIKKEFPLKIASSIFKSPVKVEVKSRMSHRNMTVNIKSDVKRRIASDPLAKYICHTCNRGDVEESMLLCDGCDDSYHTFCLIPPLTDIPKGDWRCPKCVVEEVNKPIEAFGFEQAQREYTLQQFGEMADHFKSDYFNMPVHLVPTELVEREFWRIVSSIDEDVTVEYGADLHTMDHGSGFPTKSSLYLLPGDQEYAESSWNLNNLPLLEESILGHINADISGMKVPWMYVGMCFATFCWHNEDHWSYSINYLHWGEPKTWYGVPGTKAELFEETMKSAAPELFHSQPDLLHQLVTIMNPNILMNAGVPVYRTDQHAGEFVITFPRAYHAGFNQGYNFAEAVNFAPADWMKMGRECINHYSTLRRFCVFSHDELVCKMALDPDRLNFGIATACYLDMAEMVDSEKKLRKSLLEWGVTKAEREAFELIQDDERQCEVCKTTCFLSAVGCSCCKNIVCLRHYSELCKCPPDRHTLQYRYTLDELPLMLRKLKVKAESFENWLKRIRNVINPNTVTTITLDELQELAQEAKDRKFPNSILLERLNSAVVEAEKCVTVIQQLDINKMRTRTRNFCDNTKYKLTMEELDMFVHEIDNLWCVIKEGNSVRELQEMGKEFMDNAAKLLAKPINKLTKEELENAIDEGSSLCIELPEIYTLKDRLTQVAWFYEVRQNRESSDKIPLTVLKRLLDDGMKITPHYIIEQELADLDIIIASVNFWEETAQECFKIYTENNIPQIEIHLKKADLIEGILPSYNQLKDALKKIKEWVRTVEILQSNENYPYFHTLENVVNRGKNIPFQLIELKKMEEHLASARSWKDRTSRTFLRKKSQFTLMEALSPRIEPVMFPKRKNEGENSFCKKFTEEMSPVQMVVAFKEAEEREIRGMTELRKTNSDKNPETDLYCICKRNFFGIMYNCQLCNNWFHAQCVPPPKNTVRPRPLNSTTPNLGINIPISNRDKDTEVKYLCQSCLRSRRPRLETILSLLVSLQRLPIRIPEGEALQCLTERAMNWQDRARQLLTSEEITKAIEKLSQLENIIISSTHSTNLIQQTPINPLKNKRKSSLTIRNKDSGTATETSSDEDDFPQHQPPPNSSNILSTSENGAPSPTNIEHAYSVLTPLSTGDAPQPGENCDQIENSKPPLITIQNNVVTNLEDLMMEGDLLEVSLDETNLIWRLLNATKPSYTDLSYIHYKYNIKPVTTVETNMFTIKKRKSNDYIKQQSKLPKLSDIVTTSISSSTMSTSPSVAQNIIVSPCTPPATTISSNQSVATMAAVITSSLPILVSGGESGIENKTQFKNYIKMNSTKRGRKLKLGQAFATLAQENNMKKKLKKSRKKKGRNPTTNTNTVTSSSAIADVSAISSNIEPNHNSSEDDDDEDDDDDDDDEDDDCSAVTCVRPSGREVDWVQCDGGCDKWFHMLCVGLNKNQIKPDDDFICHKCKNKKQPPQKIKMQKNNKTNEQPTLIINISPSPPILAVSTTTPEIGGSDNDKPITSGGIDNDHDGEDPKEDVITTTTTTMATINRAFTMK